MSVQDYVARFDGLTFFCYMGEDCYQGIYLDFVQFGDLILNVLCLLAPIM